MKADRKAWILAHPGKSKIYDKAYRDKIKDNKK